MVSSGARRPERVWWLQQLNMAVIPLARCQLHRISKRGAANKQVSSREHLLVLQVSGRNNGLLIQRTKWLQKLIHADIGYPDKAGEGSGEWT